MTTQKTYSAKPADVTANWWVIDAEDVVLGRLAVQTSIMLRGKHKAQYTPHIDCGDHVVVINADKIKITGKKRQDKKYFRHTGFPGGIKETTPEKILEGQFPERVFQQAVKRMITRNPLGKKQFSKLHVYAGPEHPHAAQQPKEFDFAALNPKNKRA